MDLWGLSIPGPGKVFSECQFPSYYMQIALEEVALYTVQLELNNNLEKFVVKVVVSEGMQWVAIWKVHS